MDSAHEMKVHQTTNGGFITLLKWSVPGLALATLVVILLIS